MHASLQLVVVSYSLPWVFLTMALGEGQMSGPEFSGLICHAAMHAS